MCPWNNSLETEVQHSCWSTSAEYAAAADVTATVACVTNRMADELSLPNGGYGYLVRSLDTILLPRGASSVARQRGGGGARRGRPMHASPAAPSSLRALWSMGYGCGQQ